MDPKQELGIEGAVGLAAVIGAHDALMDAAQPLRGEPRCPRIAEDDRQGRVESAVEARPGVGPVVRVLGDARRDPGVGDLENQRSPAAE
jgi:hypothetical protein